MADPEHGIPSLRAARETARAPGAYSALALGPENSSFSGLKQCRPSRD